MIRKAILIFFRKFLVRVMKVAREQFLRKYLGLASGAPVPNIPILFLVAGHHKNDPGAIANGLTEHELNKDLRRLTKNFFEFRYRDRPTTAAIWVDDDKYTLSQTNAAINAIAEPQDIKYEIHFNAAGSAKASGAEIFVSQNARPLTLRIAQESVNLNAKLLGIPNRGVKDETKSARGRLASLHGAACSMLSEIGFISSKDDMGAYEKWKHWFAVDHTDMIIRYLDSKYVW